MVEQMPRPAQDSIRGPADFSTDLPGIDAAEFVLGAVDGSILALGGVDGEGLRLILDSAEADRFNRRALLARIAPALSAEAIVEQVLNLLAETARRLWPIWFTDVSFSGCRDDTLGGLAADAIARDAAKEISGLSPSWAQAAARLALDNRPPRLKGALPAVELAQLARAISRFGLVLVADVTIAQEGPNPAALVHALEWVAQHLQGAVVALFPDLPANQPPFDRILHGARHVKPADSLASGVVETGEAGTADASLWIAPWRGLPHPLSEIEQRLAKALGADAELAPLFAFNRLIDTVRGSRPKVDIVWTEGRLVVELDGYGSHGNRTAFIYDRHRDYELTLSGYTVLRLANDEIAQDCEKAIEKIRDVVRLCRSRTISEV